MLPAKELSSVALADAQCCDSLCIAVNVLLLHAANQ